MSEEIREYVNSNYNPKIEGCSKKLHVTAFVGGKEGHSVQFTTDSDYVCLSQSQVLDLIAVLANRVNCKKGFTATGNTDLKTVMPDGQLIVENEIETQDKTRYTENDYGGEKNEKKRNRLEP